MNAETKQMYTANCRVCLLAPAMRDCERCLFNVGLEAVEAVIAEVKRLTEQEVEKVTA